MKSKPIPLVPLLNAAEFPSEIDDELVGNDIGTHYQGGAFWIDWDNPEDYQTARIPLTVEWLVLTFGEGIKKHKHFVVDPT